MSAAATLCHVPLAAFFSYRADAVFQLKPHYLQLPVVSANFTLERLVAKEGLVATAVSAFVGVCIPPLGSIAGAAAAYFAGRTVITRTLVEPEEVDWTIDRLRSICNFENRTELFVRVRVERETVQQFAEDFGLSKAGAAARGGPDAASVTNASQS